MTTNEEFIRKNKIEIVDDDKNTKLHYAAALGDVSQVEKIIATKQKLDSENYLGWTPLMMALRNGHFEVVDILLRRGADASKKNKFGANGFLICVSAGDVKTVEFLLKHLLCGGVSRQSLQKIISPISLAILFQHNSIFRLLLERNFDPNSITPLTGITPYMFAAAMQNSKAMKLLNKYKADKTRKNYLGKTASDILISKQQKVDMDVISYQQKPPNIPVILVSAQNSPQLQLTPFEWNMDYKQKRSSNLSTPKYFTPNISPIPNQQYFFGPQFPSPNDSIAIQSYNAYSFLNHNISPYSGFISPQFTYH